MDINYILNDLAEDRKNYFNAVSPPIIRTSNFAFDSVASFRKAFSNELSAHLYTRGNNPTVDILRKKIAALENTEDALMTGSGVSAISAAVMAFVQQGDHIICVKKPYSWASKLMENYLPKFGVETTFVDATDLGNIKNAIRDKTRILYLESPNSFTYEIQDLQACAQWAKKNNIITIIDNSHCSPIFQKPADFGIDIVTHSVTKYINGHSDVVAGVICGSHVHIQHIFDHEYMTFGTILSPDDAAWILRGIRTLPIRMKRIDETTNEIIAKIRNHPAVEKLIHPFEKDSPQYALAKSQMKGSGGLFTIKLIDMSIKKVESFVNGLTRFKMAVSWGGHESLILPVAAFYNMPGKPDPETPHTYMRLYVGLEDAAYLLEELIPALDKLID